MVNATQRFDHKGKHQHFKNPPRQCTFYNRSGHTIDLCYQNHGHPYFNKNKSQANASTIQNCDLVETSDTSTVTYHSSNNSTISQVKYDHLISLVQQVNLLPSANSNNTVTTSSMIHDNPSNATSSGIICTTSKILPHNKFWILDSSVNDYVCSSLHLFVSTHDIKHLNITLPNGHFIRVKQAGNIHFSSTFYLHNILYSTEFHLNLISIFKLCKSLKFKIGFAANNCVIQDLSMMKMTGLGKRIGGLYRLQMDDCSLVDDTGPHPFMSISINTILPRNNLGHFRIGHVLNKNLIHMSLLYPSISFNNKATYDIFYLAKQNKLPFCHSSSTTNSNF